MYTVRKMTEFKSRQWGIYKDGRLVEGGFFSKDMALSAMQDMQG